MNNGGKSHEALPFSSLLCVDRSVVTSAFVPGFSGVTTLHPLL